MIASIKKNPLALFVALTIIPAWLLCLLSYYGLFDIFQNPQIAVEITLSILLLGASIFLIQTLGGRKSLAILIQGLLRWRVGYVWWSVALLGPFAILVLAIVSSPILNHSDVRVWEVWQQNPVDIATLLLIALSYVICLEVSMRGFLLPLLQTRHRAFLATILIASLTLIWQLPIHLAMADLSISQFIGLTAVVLAEAIVLTFLYNGTGGSLLITISCHTLWNSIAYIAPTVSDTLITLVNAALMIVAVVIVYLLDKQTTHRGWAQVATQP